MTKLADFLVAEGVVDDISHEGLRQLLRAENVSFQRLGAVTVPSGALLEPLLHVILDLPDQDLRHGGLISRYQRD